MKTKYASKSKKEGYLALFFLIVAYLLALKCASSSALLVWWTASISLLIGLSLFIKDRTVIITPIVITSTALGGVLLYQLAFNADLLASTDYMLGAWLVLALTMGMLLPGHIANLAFRYVVLIAGLLALWGLAQYHFDVAYMVDMGHRANAIFTTPNSFAAALNLVNLLLISLYLGGFSSRHVLGITLLLFAALLTTESRGGWITFAGGLAFLTLLSTTLKQPLVRNRIFKLAGGIFTVLLIHVLVQLANIHEYAPSDVDGNQPTKFYAAELGKNMRLTGGDATDNYRLDLYADTWQLIQEAPLAGYGFMTFGDHYSRVQSSEYDKTTHFVHNDYLQIWMETGLLGLLALLSLIAACYWQPYRAWRRADTMDRTVMIGIIVALSGYFAHALVDFVFYIPALTMLAFGYMGYLNRMTRQYCSYPVMDVQRLMSTRLLTFFRVLLVVVPGWLLFEPALAQVVAQAGERLQRQAQPDKALTLYGLAQKLAPNESGYYRREAAYWLEEATGMALPQRLDNAIHLYRQSAQHNPFDLESRYKLAMLNVKYREHLSAPADAAQVRAWLGYVSEWRPWDEALQKRLRDLEQSLAEKTGTGAGGQEG